MPDALEQALRWKNRSADETEFSGKNSLAWGAGRRRRRRPPVIAQIDREAVRDLALCILELMRLEARLNEAVEAVRAPAPFPQIARVGSGRETRVKGSTSFFWAVGGGRAEAEGGDDA